MRAFSHYILPSQKAGRAAPGLFLAHLCRAYQGGQQAQTSGSIIKEESL
jgi:hypothetical protein